MNEERDRRRSPAGSRARAHLTEEDYDEVVGTEHMVSPEEKMSGREVVAEHLRWQAKWCDRLGSQLYAELLGRAAEDVEAGGPVWEILEGQEADPKDSYAALALRL